MGIRSLLLVAVLVVFGATGRSTAAVVQYGSPVVFSFDLTTVPEDYLFLEVAEVSIRCVTTVCASEFAWAYVTLDGGYILSTDENWDNSLIDWSREDERYVYSRAPYDLEAFIGSAPGLQDVEVKIGDGLNYGPGNDAYLFTGRFPLPTVPQGLKQIYVTFMEVESINSFYNVDEASIDLYWYDENFFWGGAMIEGRLYDPISYDPISQVPLPGSLPFILTSMAGALGLSLRKGRASLR
jgi:hypothetical protein